MPPWDLTDLPNEVRVDPLLPVPERGDIGILELSLAIHPDIETIAYLVSGGAPPRRGRHTAARPPRRARPSGPAASSLINRGARNWVCDRAVQTRGRRCRGARSHPVST